MPKLLHAAPKQNSKFTICIAPIEATKLRLATSGDARKRPKVIAQKWEEAA